MEAENKESHNLNIFQWIILTQINQVTSIRKLRSIQ